LVAALMPAGEPWSAAREVLTGSSQWCDLDAAGAWGPCVVATQDQTRLWYAGDDGSTVRILSATGRPHGSWERQGIAVDAGFAGDSDAYGVDSPCVVRTRGGYLMAYAGSDGADSRLHMATSADGQRWHAHGTFIQRGEPDGVGATHPCLLVAGQWWLFYAGYDGAMNGRRARILAAVSSTGASWDRLGVVLEPERDELAVREPWVVPSLTGFHMFYVSDDDNRPVIALATSSDGLTWSRRGTITAPDPFGRGVRSPCVLRTKQGPVRLWYSAPNSPEPSAPDRIWMVETPRLSL
jgi:hypothetical protein